MIKAKLKIFRNLTLITCLAQSILLADAFAQPALPDFSKARAAISPISAEEIDKVSGKSGLTDCFWVGTLSPTTFNILFPDTGVVYWATQLKLPKGSKLTFKGQYPHARYLSFASYNSQGQPLDALSDQLIKADAGSINPFEANANRNATKRNYTVNVEARAIQAGVKIDETARTQNTLLIPNDDTLTQIWLRIYVPDRGLNVKGNVSLPKPTLTLADGKILKGDALCKEIVVKEGALRDYKSNAEALKAANIIPGAKAPFHPAQPSPLNWHAFYNPQFSFLNILINTPFETLRDKADATRRSGFYGTLDNVYMSTFVDNRYGDVLTIRGVPPRTPKTYKNAAKMPSDVDLRYWSICKYRSAADGAVDDCLYDEQIPLDKEGKYTIIMTKPEHRPMNATLKCGVAWLNWGIGNSLGNPHGGFLLFRHMLAAPKFNSSLWATKKPGDERQVLSAYYPEANYETKAAFEARGCPVKS